MSRHATRRFRARARQRGFSHVSLTLEAAAVVAWFAMLVLGEKLVSDATTARRAVESSAAQSVVASAATYCEDTRAIAPRLSAYTPDARTAVGLAGKPDLGNLLSILDGLGVGAQPTFGVYTLPFKAASSRSVQGGVRGAAPVGDGEHAFEGQRTLACPERSRDTPETSIARYRTSIFNTNIKGY